MAIQVIVDGVVVYEEGDRVRRIEDKLNELMALQGDVSDLHSSVAKLNELANKLAQTAEQLQARQAAVASGAHATSSPSPSAAEREAQAHSQATTPQGATKP